MRDAGTTSDLPQRADTLRADLTDAGLATIEATLELAVCSHHAATGNSPGLQATTSRLHQLTADGDYAYYTDIAHFMADLPLPDQPASQARWLDGEQTARTRWRTLVTTRRARTARPL
ncbi:hypothetical protein SAMN05216223_13165 [Actinacidiphila yanglinensis]|uniref:Uncharacterized protein n=1 Tax=Actinacidiphila yanglinensis TaxID=310779 RepID=A0A1H6EDG5_9ACTN|nr:hypothetical protein [Actinacidiphila yanglinensis]SEG94914.1 hypothetical protein SAMN05216223_13165 [Actinacidiphila yanglinensis]